MSQYPVHVAFPGRLVFVGFGSIGQGVLPLILRHVAIKPDQITIVSADELGEKVAAEYGIRFIRHPLYLGFFLGIWATPTMTIAHLVFAVMCSAYILVGTRLEERDLRKVHPEYDRYAREVPRYLPSLRRRGNGPELPARV